MSFWKRHWERIRDWFGPQEQESAFATLADRERLRRGRLLAALLAVGYPVLLLLLPGCLLPHPVPVYLLCLAAALAANLTVTFFNRRGQVQLAACVDLIGVIAILTLALLCAPPGLLLPNCLLYIICAITVVESGFLLGRAAPFAFAAANIAVIGLHVGLNASSFQELPGFRDYPLAAIVLTPGAALILLAALACAGAGSLEDGIARADHADAVERLYRAAESQRHRAEHLGSLTAQMAGELDRDALLRQIASEIRALGYGGCSLMVVETDADGKRRLARLLDTFEDSGHLEYHHYAEDYADVACLLHGKSLRVRLPAECADYHEQARAFFRAQGVTNLLGLPIAYRGETLGALLVCATETAWGQQLHEDALSERDRTRDAAGALADPFPPAAVAFLSTLADHAAIALGNALLHQEKLETHRKLAREHEQATRQAEDLAAMNRRLLATQAELAGQYRALEIANAQLNARATTDGMTGLANHRAFQEELARQFARAQRSNAPLSLLLLDVDFFKQYNDRYGHPAGDEVLKTVGSILRAAVREGDFTARYGGEEFAVILPETDADTAQQAAERIRAAVEQTPFPHSAITVSIGVSERGSGEMPDALVQRADVALYEAKSLGRNRVYLMASPTSRAGVAGDAPDTAEPQAETGSAPTVLAVGESEILPLLAAERWLAESQDSFLGLRNASEGELHSLSELIDGGIEGLLQEPASAILSSLFALLDRFFAEPRGHSERVTRYALRLGTALADHYEQQRASRPLAPYMTCGDMADIAFGALLHDIGKIGFPDSILLKTGKLTEDEWRQIRRHPLTGAELLAGHPLLERALPTVRAHHERWDGLGYPRGLAGEAIPLCARVVSVCDTLDNLTTHRPYREALDYATARDEIARSAGTQFDPDVVAAFLALPKETWQSLHRFSSFRPAPAETDGYRNAA